MVKKKVEEFVDEPVEEPIKTVSPGAVLLYATGDTRVYQVGNARGDGSEGRDTQRITVKVTEVEEVQG